MTKIIIPPNLIPFRDVPKLPQLPARRGGGRLNLSTVWRWALKGLRARDGTLVKLRAVRCGETLCTSETWVWEFFEALTAHDPGLVGNHKELSRVRTATQRQLESEVAKKDLAKHGI